MISANWPVPVAHSARTIAPTAGFNCDRTSDSASSESTSTVCRQASESTEPGSGTWSE